MADPANIAMFGYLSQVFLKNTTTGSEILVDRVQSVEPTGSFNTQEYRELGRKGNIGITQDSPEYRISLEQNLYNNLELDYVLSGKSITPAGVQTYNMGDILTYAGLLNAYVLKRNQDLTIMNEHLISGCSVSELAFRFSVNSAITQSISLIGTSGKLYKSASAIHAWGTLDSSSLGGVHGKEARLWLTSGSTAAGRAFRLQNMNLRISFPSVFVREIGRRSLVGTVSDSPSVSLDFDILLADDQPTDKLFVDSTTYYDLDQTLTSFNAFIRVFDPTAAEGTNVIKSFKIDNVVAVSHTPVRSQVRGLSTARYSLMASKEATADNGMVTVSNSNQ